MGIKIICSDITKVKVDAIVNAANESLLGGGGVDGAIHLAAGPQLLEECKALGGCRIGEAKITKGYNLPAKFVIHTVGPIWYGGNEGEEQLLKSSYVNSLELAKENDVESIAFPLISSGAFGYPKVAAIRVALDTFNEFLADNDMEISLVVYDRKTFELSDKLYSAIEKYIGENFVDDEPNHRMLHSRRAERPASEARMSFFEMDDYPKEAREFKTGKESSQRVLYRPLERSLEDLIKEREETFSQSLLRIIDQKGMSDVEVYKRANIDRKLFSKIRSAKDYNPSKVTAIAFAIALGLSVDETLDLIGKAGFTLSASSKFDLIIRYFIEQENYQIYEINEALFAFDQRLLGL